MPAAALTALHIEPAGGHRVPEGRGLGVGNRVRLLHQLRPRTSVAAELSTPPVPFARARLAPSTWRGPHSPLSWRVGPGVVKIPYMPGWQAERPPPLGFVGEPPPGAVAARYTNAPLSLLPPGRTRASRHTTR